LQTKRPENDRYHARSLCGPDLQRHGRAVREQPFGPGMVVWTIDGHMFAAYTEAGHGLSVRVPEAEADEMAANRARGKPHAADGRGLGPDPLAYAARGPAPPHRGLLRAWSWPTATRRTEPD
jgi:hypothetical protein